MNGNTLDGIEMMGTQIDGSDQDAIKPWDQPGWGISLNGDKTDPVTLTGSKQRGRGYIQTRMGSTKNAWHRLDGMKTLWMKWKTNGRDTF